jgi:hypothetical protein
MHSLKLLLKSAAEGSGHGCDPSHATRFASAIGGNSEGWLLHEAPN